MNIVDLPPELIRQIAFTNSQIPRNSEQDIQTELEDIDMRIKMLHVSKIGEHMHLDTKDDVRNSAQWPYRLQDSFCFLSNLALLHENMDYAGIIQGLHDFLNDQLVQVSALSVLAEMLRRDLDSIEVLYDAIYDVACTSIRAYPSTLVVLDAACDVLHLIMAYANRLDTQRLCDDKILHILKKAQNHLRFTPGDNFVLMRKSSELDKLISYSESFVTTLLGTHALDYTLPTNSDGVAFTGPDTVFVDDIPHLVSERNVGSLLLGMREFISFAFVQEQGCASLWEIVKTNSGGFRMDWYDGRVAAPHAPDGSLEPIEDSFPEIFTAAVQAMTMHPTCVPVMKKACKLLVLIMVMPHWFDELERSNVVRLAIEVKLNFCYQLGDNFILRGVPKDIEELLNWAQRRRIGNAAMDFDTLQTACALISRDVSSLTTSFLRTDYHRVHPPNAAARGVHTHLWRNRQGEIPFY